jgi:hypothetical protein
MASLNEISRILAANMPPPQGFGGNGTCPSFAACWDQGEPGRGGFDFNWWMSSSSPQPSAPAVTYTPYAGLIADDTGVSSGGAVATSTIAAYEHGYIGSNAQKLPYLGMPAGISNQIAPNSLIDNAILSVGPNGEQVMTVDFTIAGDGVKRRTLRRVVRDIRRDLNVAGTIGSDAYQLVTNVSVVDQPLQADVVVQDAIANAYTNHRVDNFGGRYIYIVQDAMRRSTGAHEMGHLLGYRHSANCTTPGCTGELMSYNYKRQLSIGRVRDLQNAYRVAQQIQNNPWVAPPTQ